MLALGVPSAVSAHSLGSSTIAVRIEESGVEATITVAIESLETALGVTGADDATIVQYLDARLTLTGPLGVEWAETYTDPTRTTIEGIDSFSVIVAFENGTEATDQFTVDYDAIIDAIPEHKAVVVLTNSSDEISTAGVITSADPTLAISDGRPAVPVADMIHFGYEHVLDGADHLLFLATLVLPAAFVASGGRWSDRRTPLETVRRVVHIVTAFTVGHSITLIASALGWVSFPSRPVEVLVAVSVAASAINAIRPLTNHSEVSIAGGFGLVHGLAFAGILADLGLDGSASLLTLLSFNVGVELAQLLAIALLLPSIYAISRTRWATPFRVTAASLALLAALGWLLERVGLMRNPFLAIETAITTNPWTVVIALAAIASAALLADRCPFKRWLRIQQREPAPMSTRGQARLERECRRSNQPITSPPTAESRMTSQPGAIAWPTA